MSSAESFSFPDAEFHQTMDLLALRLGLAGMAKWAESANQQHVAEASSAGFKTELRYTLTEEVNRYVPVRALRIILAPERDEDKRFDIDRVILRAPDSLRGRQPLPIADPSDVFVEIVDFDGGRTRHVVNTSGLWEYQSADELRIAPDLHDGGDLFVPGGSAVFRPERVNTISRLLSHPPYRPVLQSSSNVEREQ